MSKKNLSNYGVHGIQIDRLRLMASKQKSSFKKCTEFRDTGQNVTNFAGLVWKADFQHFFYNILGLGAYFSKPIFALKP